MLKVLNSYTEPTDRHITWKFHQGFVNTEQKRYQNFQFQQCCGLQSHIKAPTKVKFAGQSAPWFPYNAKFHFEWSNVSLSQGETCQAADWTNTSNLYFPMPQETYKWTYSSESFCRATGWHAATARWLRSSAPGRRSPASSDKLAPSDPAPSC